MDERLREVCKTQSVIQTQKLQITSAACRNLEFDPISRCHCRHSAIFTPDVNQVGSKTIRLHVVEHARRVPSLPGREI